MPAIERLETAHERDLMDMNKLLLQLRSNPADATPGTMGDLLGMTKNDNCVVVVAREAGHIVGLGILFIMPKLGERIAEIHDVVVDASHRGQGIGKLVVNELIEAAKEKKVKTLALTSRPSREAANRLYQNLNFDRVETNVYRMKL
jgi:ribosomal protein S18 acetylase RimI-like enzyme